MKSGYDGEYYYIVLDKEEDLIKLKELVLRKVRERSNSK
jgi:hypothetical protein